MCWNNLFYCFRSTSIVAGRRSCNNHTMCGACIVEEICCLDVCSACPSSRFALCGEQFGSRRANNGGWGQILTTGTRPEQTAVFFRLRACLWLEPALLLLAGWWTASGLCIGFGSRTGPQLPVLVRYRSKKWRGEWRGVQYFMRT